MNGLTDKQRWDSLVSSVNKLRAVEDITLKAICPVVINYNKYLYAKAVNNGEDKGVTETKDNLSVKEYAKIRLMELKAEEKKLQEALADNVTEGN